MLTITKHWLQSVRKQLSLSQAAIAHFLQLSRHTIQAIELGRRALPLTQSASYGLILFDIVDQTPPQTAPSQAPTPAEIEQRQHALKRQYRVYEKSLEDTTRKLAAVKARYEQGLFNLAVYQQLSTSLSPANEAEQVYYEKWIEHRIIEAETLVMKNSLVRQELLEVKITGLKAMMAQMEGLMAGGEEN